MAMSSVSIRAKTVETVFHDLPAEETHFFQVKAGVSADFALSAAWAFESAVREMLDRAISGDEMDANSAALCRLALDAASALRAACGAETLLPELQTRAGEA